MVCRILWRVAHLTIMACFGSVMQGGALNFSSAARPRAREKRTDRTVAPKKRRASAGAAEIKGAVKVAKRFSTSTLSAFGGGIEAGLCRMPGLFCAVGFL